MVVASQKMQAYFSELEAGLDAAMKLASLARAQGRDAAEIVEIAPARDVAARVEGLVGPAGIADRIRELSQTMKREEVCFAICKEIMEKKFCEGNEEQLMEQAVRTGLALFTEGVVSAPIEGISRVKKRKNTDGSECLALYFTGPIRGAGGTGQAFSLLLGDYCRRFFKIQNYRPGSEELDRYVEELNLYAIRTRAGQYVPTEEEVRHVVSNCPVCVDGEPTEDYEVSVHKNTPGVETNRVRSGVCLVISEGICLKAAKVKKIAKKAGLDSWDWLDNLIKVAKKDTQKFEFRPIERYMEEIVGGRPIFSYPMRAGGFRLRYGRTRFCGILSKAIHPATMTLLDDFPVFGTQVKTERPGKGCIVTPCETIDGPTVLLDDGEVLQVNDLAQAEKLRERVKEILFLGDMLVCYGDFNKANHPLAASAWCDEWYQLELKSAGVEKTREEISQMSFDEALALSKKHDVPLAPKFVFYWHDLTPEELQNLALWLASGKMEYEWFDLKSFKVPNSIEKTLLEKAGVPHKLEANEVVIETDTARAICCQLGLLDGKALSQKRFSQKFSLEKNVMELVNELASVKIHKKAGLYIGTSMGRPEKSRERIMKPLVHGLFPVGNHGGSRRDIVKAVRDLKASGTPLIEVELNSRSCASCGKKTFSVKCSSCGSQTIEEKTCQKCGRKVENECGDCNTHGKPIAKQKIDLPMLFDNAVKRVSFKPTDFKGVVGLISAGKVPEQLEKGILRAKHGLSVFRDGTCRYDATEIPCTHFIPAEIGITVEKARELGYECDDANQLLELKAQDIILAKHASDYLLRVARFTDDLLVENYGLPAFYNTTSSDSLIGQLLIAIAPHTSAGIVCRLIGFTEVRGILAHPYLHCACRRNADGDELCVMMLLDGFLNFSKQFLPETRGGKMDAPLVLTTILDPREVDDEVHAMDRAWSYSLDFYRATLNNVSPSEAEVPIIGDELGKEGQYEGIGCTHSASISGPVTTRYVQLKNMAHKVEEELKLMTKIRAVDEQNAAERIILSHFFPDLYGNLRSFSKQKFRCTECNAKYRRVPLSGKCRRCGGKLLLTISKGGIEKYLSISREMAEKY
ncbi:MAG: DNA polymerase II large subunit, partial [Candidatus Micrarchaeota archaeon]